MKGKIESDEGLTFAPPPIGHRATASTSPQAGLDHLEFLLASATVFLAPLSFLRHPSVHVTLSDVFAFVCLFVMLLNRSLPLRPLGSASPFWIVGLALLIGGLMVSSILYGSTERGIVVSGQYFVAYLVFPIVVVWRPWDQLVALTKIFLICLIFLCIHGIYLIHIDGELNTRFVSGTGRLRSIMETENGLAALIALTSTLLIWLGATGCIHRLTALFAWPLLVYGLILTGSNTGLLTMMYGCGLYFLITISWRRLAFGLAALVAFVAVMAYKGKEYLPPAFQKRVLGFLESGDIDKAGSFSHRYELMVEAQQTINDAMLLGIGADQYKVMSRLEIPVHNAYLLIWSEGGLIALIGFLLVVFSGLVVLPGAIRQMGGWLTAASTFSVVTQFAFLINAVPHVYARRWVVPVLLGIAISDTYARDGPIPAYLRKSPGNRYRNRFRWPGTGS